VSRWLLVVGATVAVYLVVLVSLDPWDVAIGTALAVALAVGARRFLALEGPPRGPGLVVRLVAFWPFAAAVAWDILVGTWHVALVTLRLRPLVSPGIVKVPIGPRTPNGVAITALVLTLSPGEFLVDVDWEERVMLIHALDAADPDAVRRHHERFYERFQRNVFP
jgi:multicomponent Na+:H+ antiporter subunit E